MRASSPCDREVLAMAGAHETSPAARQMTPTLRKGAARSLPLRVRSLARGGFRAQAVASVLLVCGSASAQTAPSLQTEPGPPTGAPPPDAKALVTAAKGPGDAPTLAPPASLTSVTLSSGGLLTSGNSRLLALTAQGGMEYRRDANAMGASVLANYGEGGPNGQPVQLTALNLQGRTRYDRYVVEQASLFLITTGRHDRFQGLDFRLNLDPGLKYLLWNADASAVWAELGYDFQHDIRRNEDRITRDANKNPVLDPAGQPVLVDKTFTDHSSRLFAGARHAFNKEVNLSGGVEYLQSFTDTKRYRLNFDALFAAKVGGGFAIGLGFAARYDNFPLPGKRELDTATNVSLIYSFSETPASADDQARARSQGASLSLGR